MTTRREFLNLSYLAVLQLLWGCAPKKTPARFDVTPNILDAELVQNGQQVHSLVPFLFENGNLETKLGHGLNGRQYANVAKFLDESYCASAEKFYLRTFAPVGLNLDKTWFVNLIGAKVTKRIAVADILHLQQEQGMHFMECSGNSRDARFGMLSTARWSGINLMQLLHAYGMEIGRGQILISGVDDPDKENRVAEGSASWIFKPDELKHAFLATTMNGHKLSLDHGFPLRLIVPGWYGCVCIKWVNEIRLVEDTAASTPQMREFASRTGQVGVPVLARDFKPAVIQFAAMPILVEKWLYKRKPIYRIRGISWGAEKEHEKKLLISCALQTPKFEPVQNAQLDRLGSCWSNWSHVWQPTTKGVYKIQLKLEDDDTSSTISTRLNRGYYTRSVGINDV